MRNYYENDIRMLRSNIRGELLRIKHVNDITSKMFNINLQEILLQKNVLYEIKLWLEPLPDKSLPNIKIKKQLLELLNGMNLITKNDLLKSDIGKIVNFYAQNMKESYEVRSLASSIIKKWKLVVIKEERS
ncbi:IWS1 [Hepatospora eriocheir]|nr:IWS1 [Hepatospora eriocheir]